MLDKRGIFKKIKYGEVGIWSVVACFNKYCLSYEQDCLNPGLSKFYIKASDMTKNDLIMCDIWAKSLIKKAL